MARNLQTTRDFRLDNPALLDRFALHRTSEHGRLLPGPCTIYAEVEKYQTAGMDYWLVSPSTAEQDTTLFHLSTEHELNRHVE